eukprot:441767-Rhodomonas_salina.5
MPFPRKDWQHSKQGGENELSIIYHYVNSKLRGDSKIANQYTVPYPQRSNFVFRPTGEENELVIMYHCLAARIRGDADYTAAMPSLSSCCCSVQ